LKLKDVVYCVRDRRYEYPENLNDDTIEKEKQAEPLSFFFIHDRLYVHPSRDNLSRDNKEQILSLEKYINQTKCMVFSSFARYCYSFHF
jgi:hypothetical protein